MPLEDDDLPGETTPKPAAKPTSKAAPVVAVEDEETEAAAPKKHVHSKLLVKTATEFGITQEDLDAFPSADIWEEIHRIQALHAARTEPKKETPTAPVVEEEFNLDNPEIDPLFAKFLKKQQKELAEAKAKLADVDELKKNEQQRTARRNTEIVEDAFASLDKRFIPIAGEGSIEEITDAGMKARRLAIFHAAQIDLARDSARTMKQKIQKAADSLYPGKATPAAEVEEEESPYAAAAKPAKKVPAKDPETGRFTVEDFEAGQVARASGKKIAAGDLDAVEATRQYLKKNGDPRGYRRAVDLDDDLPG